jgi:hypothetical protein
MFYRTVCEFTLDSRVLYPLVFIALRSKLYLSFWLHLAQYYVCSRNQIWCFCTKNKYMNTRMIELSTKKQQLNCCPIDSRSWILNIRGVLLCLTGWLLWFYVVKLKKNPVNFFKITTGKKPTVLWFNKLEYHINRTLRNNFWQF